MPPPPSLSSSTTRSSICSSNKAINPSTREEGLFEVPHAPLVLPPWDWWDPTQNHHDQQEEEEDKKERSSSSGRDRTVVARVYQDVPVLVVSSSSTTTTTKCGHALLWSPCHVVDATHCPICQTPIRHVVVQSSPPSSSLSPAPRDGEENEEVGRDFLKLHYGTKTFWIPRFLPPNNNNNDNNDKNNNNNDNNNDISQIRPSWWIQRIWLLPRTSTTTTMAATTTTTTARTTAQECIQSTLGLADGFKILHRGKVLFPPPPLSNVVRQQQLQQQQQQANKEGVVTTTTTISTLLAISERIVHLSQQPGETLLVMGTLRGRELKSPPPSHHVQQESSPSTPLSSLSSWMRCLFLDVPYGIVYYGTLSLWHLIQSFVAPFFLLGGQEAPPPRRRPHSD